MARRSVAAYERVLVRERRSESTWSLAKPMLKLWIPAPAFRRLLKPAAVGGETPQATFAA